MSKSKCNPRRRPATQADVVKAKKEALNEAIKNRMGNFLYSNARQRRVRPQAALQVMEPY